MSGLRAARCRNGLRAAKQLVELSDSPELAPLLEKADQIIANPPNNQALVAAQEVRIAAGARD